MRIKHVDDYLNFFFFKGDIVVTPMGVVVGEKFVAFGKQGRQI